MTENNVWFQSVKYTRIYIKYKIFLIPLIGVKMM